MTAAVLSLADANAQADAVARRLDGGWLYLYAGPVPGDADEPLTAARHRLLARVPLGNPSAPAARAGRVAFTPRAAVPVVAGGRPRFFRALTMTGAPVFQGTAGPRAETPALVVDAVPLRDDDLLELASFAYEADREADE